GDPLVDVGHADEWDDRHQQLVLYEWVALVRDLAERDADIVVAADADLAEDHARAFADPVAVHVIVWRDDELLELLDVAAADIDGAKALHLALEHVGDVGDGDDLFLGDADDVAVETGTAYDALGCAGDVGGLVDDHGWVAGAC